jgi:hypothetical protein
MLLNLLSVVLLGFTKHEAQLAIQERCRRFCRKTDRNILQKRFKTEFTKKSTSTPRKGTKRTPRKTQLLPSKSFFLSSTSSQKVEKGRQGRKGNPDLKQDY